ncbi:YeeE/YedE family protein [Bdellovibrio sp. GT3]|uniref:YeeE/YedE family protein n=1 Tax=Bdellovibrio sp. GT3 TaxID=3136282 RepID=UPI0030F0679A
MKRLADIRNWSALLVGVLFAVGLSISGMTQPKKILDFLTFGAGWDPSLLFVMIGAVPVYMITYRLVRGRKTPVLDTQFYIPKKTEITKPLIVGSVIFGFGWGLGGYCPGPGLVSLGTGSVTAIVFVFSMMSGMLIYRMYERWIELRKKN